MYKFILKITEQPAYIQQSKPLQNKLKYTIYIYLSHYINFWRKNILQNWIKNYTWYFNNYINILFQDYLHLLKEF